MIPVGMLSDAVVLRPHHILVTGISWKSRVTLGVLGFGTRSCTFLRIVRVNNLLKFIIAGVGAQPGIPVGMHLDPCMLCPLDVFVASISRLGCVACTADGCLALKGIQGTLPR